MTHKFPCFDDSSGLYKRPLEKTKFFIKKLLTNQFKSVIIYRSIAVDAAMAQSVERVLGKDEVPSSNLGSSSKIKSTPKGEAT